MSNWIKNPGYMTPAYGTLVDVRYRNGDENLHVHAGWPHDDTGSDSPSNASDWSLDGSRMDIVEWRLHGAPEQTPEQTPEAISSEIKQTNINLLCAKILEQDRIAGCWLLGEEPSVEEQEAFVRLDGEIVALAKGMIDL